MVWRDTNVSLSMNITTAIRMNNLLCQHRANTHLRADQSTREPIPRAWEEGLEPMQLGQILPKEQQHQNQLRLCFYCGGRGHRVSAYPELPTTTKVGDNHFHSSLTLPVRLCTDHTPIFVTVIIYSGSSINLIA